MQLPVFHLLLEDPSGNVIEPRAYRDPDVALVGATDDRDPDAFARRGHGPFLQEDLP